MYLTLLLILTIQIVMKSISYIINKWKRETFLVYNEFSYYVIWFGIFMLKKSSKQYQFFNLYKICFSTPPVLNYLVMRLIPILGQHPGPQRRILPREPRRPGWKPVRLAIASHARNNFGQEVAGYLGKGCRRLLVQNVKEILLSQREWCASCTCW